ncbi:lipoprotein insertase outer membrane protein LolB [Vibrio rumoiensis]|uniref:lipoprotein insertase outer membrane protein LolB n=1 Tax=Vibrio rumoiensis TaxID=76258 RepID=UPI000367A657|nr:lipoprotein insertase outer membrane protein LolB [Vibrio rumoiensis]
MSFLSSLSPLRFTDVSLFSRIQDRSLKTNSAFRAWAWFPITCLLLIISGCSSVPPSQENYSVDWQSHKQKLEQLNTFKVSGKIGYKDPENRQSLNFILKHASQYDELKLLSFLGQTVLTVQMTPSGAMITTSDGQVRTAKQANDLIKELTGLSIPVSQLPDWIKGLPTEADNVAYNQSHTVESLEKNIDNRQWKLTYVSYQSTSVSSDSTLPLPNQLFLEQDATQIKILISKWIF